MAWTRKPPGSFPHGTAIHEQFERKHHESRQDSGFVALNDWCRLRLPPPTRNLVAALRRRSPPGR